MFEQRAAGSLVELGKEFKRPLTTWNDPDYKYFDVASINVTSGDGGLGCKSFRRAPCEELGGPNGGNGGKGGHVILKCVAHRNNLAHLKSVIHYKAERGRHGAGKEQHGQNGQHCFIEVPPGTVVHVRDAWVAGTKPGRITQQNSGEHPLQVNEDVGNLHCVGELTTAGQMLRVARGGQGGRGNKAFKTHSMTAPWIKEFGEKGFTRWIHIELKLFADIGIIGLPNAGKSSLLMATTNKVPKIAPWPFTTIVPNLGTYNAEDNGGITLCDVPGLVEGAHEGRGMGFQFLRHVERCRALIHVVSANAADPIGDFMRIQHELKMYSSEVALKPQVVVVNKCDITETQDILPELMAALRKQCGHSRVFDISAATKYNCDKLMQRVYKWYRVLAKDDPNIPINVQDTEQVVNTRYLAALGESMPETNRKELIRLDMELVKGRHEKKGAYEVKIEYDVLESAWRVKHPQVERVAKMTDWSWADAHDRFNRVCKACGVIEALAAAGVQESENVIAGTHAFTYNPSMIGTESRMLLYEMDLEW